MDLIIGLVAGVIIGAAVTFVWARGHLGEVEAERDQARISADFWEKEARAHIAEKMTATGLAQAGEGGGDRA